MQYTIRSVPKIVDRALRQKARAEGKSLNQAAVDALAQGAGVSRRKQRDLSDIAGTCKPDKATEKALTAQDRVNGNVWR